VSRTVGCVAAHQKFRNYSFSSSSSSSSSSSQRSMARLSSGSRTISPTLRFWCD